MNIQFPNASTQIPDIRVFGTAFFPGGAGLWAINKNGNPWKMVISTGKVMILGNNFGSESFVK
jgi:hypothetical protein